MKHKIIFIFLFAICCKDGIARPDWIYTGSAYTSTIYAPYTQHIPRKHAPTAFRYTMDINRLPRSSSNTMGFPAANYYESLPDSALFSDFTPSIMYNPLSHSSFYETASMFFGQSTETGEEDEWTPEGWDGPSVIDPGDPIPVGDASWLLLFAVIYAGFITMKIKHKSVLTTILILLLSTPFSTATNYFFANSSHGTGDGTSWDNAKSAGGLRDALVSASSGDIFYLAAENFYSGTKTGDKDVLWVIPAGVTVYGGYNLSYYHGTNTTINYDTLTTYTQFKGNQYTGTRPQIYIGPDPDHPTSTDNTNYYSEFATVSIYGISFQDAPGMSTSNYIGNGLLIRHARVDFYHCRFTNNVSAKNNAALVAWGSQIRCYDCIFRNNKAAASGSAFCIRARNSKTAAADITARDKSLALFERCEFANDSCTGAYGACGAISDNAGSLCLINSTMYGAAGTYGGSIRVSTNCIGYFISNTFTNNCHTSENIHGENISAGSGSSCYFVNNIITQYHDTYYTVKLDGTNKISAGYNFIGKTNLTANTANKDKIDSVSYTNAKLFGTNIAQMNGGTSKTIKPKMEVKTVNVASLNSLVSSWNMPSVFTEKMRLDVDQRTYPRGASTNGITSAGAYDAAGNARFYSNGAGSGAKNGFSWDNAKPSDELAYDLHYPGKIQTFYVMTGNYSPRKVNGGNNGTAWSIANGVTIRGGYPLDRTGLNTANLSYPEAEQTVLTATDNATYPFVRIGQGSNTSSSDSYYAKNAAMVQFYGITFSGARVADAGYTGIMLFIKHARVDFNYCIFKDNIGTVTIEGNNSAGAAIQSWGSQVRCYDCIFRNNTASSGAVLMQRARNSSISASEVDEGLSIFERCEFSENRSSGNYGGAFSICDNAGTLAMVNCTMSGTSQVKGGAIRISSNCKFYAASCSFFNCYNTDSLITPSTARGDIISFDANTNRCTMLNNIVVNTIDLFDTNHPVVQWGTNTTLTDGGYSTYGTINRLGGQTTASTTEYPTSSSNVHLFNAATLFGHNHLTNHGGFSRTITPVQQWDNATTPSLLASSVATWNIPLLNTNATYASFSPSVDQRKENRSTEVTLRGAVEKGIQEEHVFVCISARGKQDGSTWEDALGADQLTSVLQNAGYGVTFHLQRGRYTNLGQGYTIPEGVTIKGGYPSTMTGTDTHIEYAMLDTTMLSILDAEYLNTSRPYIRVGAGSATASPDENLSKNFEPCAIWGCEICNASRSEGGSYNGNMIFVKHAQLNLHYCYLHHALCSPYISGGKQVYSKNSAIVAWGSIVKCYDCIFRNNQGAGAGSAVVMRQHNSATDPTFNKDLLSLGVFQRCLFDNNLAIVDSAYGGTMAQSDYSGTMVLVNNTFKGGYCSAYGGALRISTADTLFAVSNTFYGASTKSGSGDAVSLGHLAIGYMLNNIIVAQANSDSKPVINIQQSSTRLISYGYNYFGYVKVNGGTYTKLVDNDLVGQTQTTIFGSNTASLKHAGRPWNCHEILRPISMTSEVPVSYLRQVINGWKNQLGTDLCQELTDDIDLDQSARTRPDHTWPGAIDWRSEHRYRLICRLSDGTEYASNPAYQHGDTMSLYYNTQGGINLQYRDGVWTDSLLNISSAASGFNQGNNIYTTPLQNIAGHIGLSGASTTLYNGNYYIRTYAVPSSLDTFLVDSLTMTAFDPSMSVGYNEGNPHSYYNHYWVRHLPVGSDVTTCVANRFNRRLLSTWLGADKYTNQQCKLTEAAQVRLGYNNLTNQLSRTELADMSRAGFLTMYGTQLYRNSTGTDAVTSNNQATFTYSNSAVYECDLYAASGAEIVVMQQYRTDQNYLFGLNGNTPITHQVLIGQANTNYALRFMYDYPTNSFSEAWLPNGTTNTDLVLNAQMFAIRQNNESASQLRLGNGISITNIKRAYLVMEIDKPSCSANGPIYWFSLPFDCNISQITGPGIYGKAWIIQYYRGDKRAQNGWQNESQTFWSYKSPTSTLSANEGYVLVLDTNKITWGEVYKNNQLTQATRIYFPTQGDQSYSLENMVDDTTNITSLPCSIAGREIADANWHIIGAPSFSDLQVKHYTWPDPTIPNYIYEWSWNHGNQRYDVVNVTDKRLEGYVFKAFHGYMTQYGGIITWADHAGLAETFAPIASRTTYEQSDHVQLNLTIDSIIIDKTFIGLSDQGTIGYDANVDLCKIINFSLPQIYSTTMNIHWAANCLPNQDTDIPIGINVTQDGDYTITVEHPTLHFTPYLLDLSTGLRTNLNQTVYTTHLAAGSYTNRFVLQFNSSSSPTSIDPLSITDHVQIFDILGREMGQGDASSVWPQLPVGTYVIKHNQLTHIAVKPTK